CVLSWSGHASVVHSSEPSGACHPVGQYRQVGKTSRGLEVRARDTYNPRPRRFANMAPDARFPKADEEETRLMTVRRPAPARRLVAALVVAGLAALHRRWH